MNLITNQLTVLNVSEPWTLKTKPLLKSQIIIIIIIIIKIKIHFTSVFCEVEKQGCKNEYNMGPIIWVDYKLIIAQMSL